MERRGEIPFGGVVKTQVWQGEVFWWEGETSGWWGRGGSGRCLARGRRSQVGEGKSGEWGGMFGGERVRSQFDNSGAVHSLNKR